jgi:hypothetical protein
MSSKKVLITRKECDSIHEYSGDLGGGRVCKIVNGTTTVDESDVCASNGSEVRVGGMRRW